MNVLDKRIVNRMQEDEIQHYQEETESLDAALAWAQPGDLVIMIALERSQALYDKLRELS